MQLKSRERILKNEGEWTRKVEIKKRKKILAESKACEAIFWPTPGSDGRTFMRTGFPTEGTLISVSAVPYCGRRRSWQNTNKIPVETKTAVRTAPNGTLRQQPTVTQTMTHFVWTVEQHLTVPFINNPPWHRPWHTLYEQHQMVPLALNFLNFIYIYNFHCW